jgi:hypothetical protein
MLSVGAYGRCGSGWVGRGAGRLRVGPVVMVRVRVPQRAGDGHVLKDALDVSDGVADRQLLLLVRL